MPDVVPTDAVEDSIIESPSLRMVLEFFGSSTVSHPLFIRSDVVNVPD